MFPFGIVKELKFKNLIPFGIVKELKVKKLILFRIVKELKFKKIKNSQKAISGGRLDF